MPQEKAKNHKLKAVPKFVSPSAASDTAEITDECPKCFGTGMEVVPGKGARICPCRNLESSQGQFEVGFGLPPRYIGFHFGNYKPTTESQKIAREYAINLTTAYPAVDRGILFSGNVGIGKTHLAVSILKGLLERGFSCRFYDFASLLKEIQDSYNSKTQTSELSVLSPVLNAEVLVLDELGSSKPTDWVRETMSYIINTRYNNKKLTIFTTNFPDARQSDDKETLEDRIGVLLRSRLFEMCKTISMDGRDFRRNFDRSLAAKK